MEPEKIVCSIGDLLISAGARDWVNIESPRIMKEIDGHEYEGYDYLHLHASIARMTDGSWSLDPPMSYYDGPGGEHSPAPEALTEEVEALGRQWAIENPQAFEDAARDEFNDSIQYVLQDGLGELITNIETAIKAASTALEEPEFQRQASKHLTLKIKFTLKACRSMRQQIKSMAKAIATAAGQSVAKEVAS